jgi:hypothetical protein
LNNNQTKTDQYKLTAAEERLLEVLINPENYGKSITEKCLIADICKDTYYRIMRNQEFTDYYNEQIKSNLKNSVGEIIQATKNFAVRFPGNHQDRKILLEMAGAYTEKSEVKHTGEVMIDIRLSDDDVPEDMPEEPVE